MRIALCVGAGLALLAGPALAQRTERPEVRVGDRWQFVRYYSVPSTKPNLAWEINSVTATEISGTENGEPLLMTPDLNVVDSPMNKQSNPKALSFPLEVGNRWRFASDWLFKPKGSKGSMLVDVEVVAYERVAVPAGFPKLRCYTPLLADKSRAIRTESPDVDRKINISVTASIERRNILTIGPRDVRFFSA